MIVSYKSLVILFIMNTETILQNLKRLRKEKGVTQEEMANKLGISRVTYYSIESGKQELSIQKIDEIIKILDISIFDLIKSEILNTEKDNIITEVLEVRKKLDNIENKLKYI